MVDTSDTVLSIRMLIKVTKGKIRMFLQRMAATMELAFQGKSTMRATSF